MASVEEKHAAIFAFMKLQLGLRIGIALSFAALVSSPARGQVLVETARILTPKKKDLGAIIDKAGKQPGSAQPRVETPSPQPQPSVAASKPSVLPDIFNSDTEDPASILDINTDVMTRFSASLAAEVAKRADSQNPLTRASYDSIGAAAWAFTPRQYFVLKARVRPFCDAVAAGQPPPDDLRFSYMPLEAKAIKPRCAALLPALKVIPAK